MSCTRKYFRISALLLSCLLAFQAVAQTGPSPDAAKMKQKLGIYGTGQSVRLSETNGREITGNIVALGDTSVTMQAAGGAPMEVSYAEITAVHNPPLTKKTKIVLAVVGIAVVTGIILGAVFAHGSH